MSNDVVQEILNPSSNLTKKDLLSKLGIDQFETPTSIDYSKGVRPPDSPELEQLKIDLNSGEVKKYTNDQLTYYISLCGLDDQVKEKVDSHWHQSYKRMRLVMILRKHLLDRKNKDSVADSQLKGIANILGLQEYLTPFDRKELIKAIKRRLQ